MLTHPQSFPEMDTREHVWAKAQKIIITALSHMTEFQVHLVFALFVRFGSVGTR